MLENKYVFWAITGAIGALCSAVAYFVKRNQDKMEKRIAAQEQRTREVEEKLNKTISDMPYLYTLREDFIRSTANHDRKLDQIISLLAKGGNSNG